MPCIKCQKYCTTKTILKTVGPPRRAIKHTVEIEKNSGFRRKVSVEPLLACTYSINLMNKLAKFIVSSSFQLFSFPTTSARLALQTIHSVKFLAHLDNQE
jgi:hypothetical protein